MRWTEQAGDLKAEFILEDGKIYRRMTAVNKRETLERNQEAQKGNQPVRSLDWAGLELSIPTDEYHMLLSTMPDLRSDDKDIQQRAWQKLLASDLSDRWRVKARKRHSGLTRVVQ